jgi:hypothetical protein
MYIIIQSIVHQLIISSSSISLVLISIIGFYLLYLLFNLPYKNPIHNLALVINQISVLFTVIWIRIKGQSFYDNNIENIFLYIFTATIGLVLLFALLRIII